MCIVGLCVRKLEKPFENRCGGCSARKNGGAVPMVSSSKAGTCAVISMGHVLFSANGESVLTPNTFSVAQQATTHHAGGHRRWHTVHVVRSQAPAGIRRPPLMFAVRVNNCACLAREMIEAWTADGPSARRPGVARPSHGERTNASSERPSRLQWAMS